MILYIDGLVPAMTHSTPDLQGQIRFYTVRTSLGIDVCPMLFPGGVCARALLRQIRF